MNFTAKHRFYELGIIKKIPDSHFFECVYTGKYYPLVKDYSYRISISCPHIGLFIEPWNDDNVMHPFEQITEAEDLKEGMKIRGIGIPSHNVVTISGWCREEEWQNAWDLVSQAKEEDKRVYRCTSSDKSGWENIGYVRDLRGKVESGQWPSQLEWEVLEPKGDFVEASCPIMIKQIIERQICATRKDLLMKQSNVQLEWKPGLGPPYIVDPSMVS